jgi:hypothetical protein
VNRATVTSPPEASAWRGVVRQIPPKEHGSWSLVLEPLILGLAVAPSLPGAALAVAVLAGFFLRRPLKVLLGTGDDPRHAPALAATLILGTLALVGLTAAAMAGWTHLWPWLLVVPPGLVFLRSEARGESRQAVAEAAGTLAFAVVPVALASVAGWGAAPALALGGVMAGRSLPTVLMLRAYLRRRKGESISGWPVWLAAAAALVASGLLARVGLAPWTVPAAFLVLLVRTGIMIGPWAPEIAATKIGIAESVLGAVLVIAIAVSWH